jgi:PAS domain S-box-containing protein
VEYRYRRPEGEWRWMSHASRIHPASSNGQPLRLVGIVQDITKRKRAEEALLDSEEKFKTVFLNSPDALYVATLEEGRILDVNDAFTALFGFSKEEIIGRTSLELNLYFEPVDRAKVVADLKAGGRVSGFETRARKKNGELFIVSLSITTMITHGVKHIIGSIMDISERKRAEEEKLKLEGQLQQAQKMESVGRLAGGVAHDFNNMLGVILGHAGIAIHQIGQAHPVHQDLAEILKAVSRSSQLTRQLLAFARRQTIAPKVLNLNETIASMLKMLERLIGENIQLQWRPAADLWSVRIDPSQVDQILANLCVNARDAIADIGRIVIETKNCTIDREHCTFREGCTPGDYACLTVSDDGHGIDKDILSHVFEPFFTTKGLGQGTGLGLATVYGAVRQNNGFINVESEPGSGTTITICLPRNEGERELSPPEEMSPGMGFKETVLLVEDEPAILTLATRMLTMLGHTVLAANSPLEAIWLAQEYAGEITLLMTDVIMPEMNGRSLAEKLKSMYSDIECLFMSGYTADVISHQGVLAPGTHFLQKPFSKNDLAAALEAIRN